MLDQLIEKKDLLAYIAFRSQHLELEKQKVPFLNIENKMKEVAIKKLRDRMEELNVLKKYCEANAIKDASKYFYSKVVHLNKMKVMHIKEKKGV